MARSSSKIGVFATFSFDYEAPADMPWDTIEGACQKQFTSQDRGEIFECRVEFDACYALQANAPRAEEVFKLVERIERVVNDIENLRDETRDLDRWDAENLSTNRSGRLSREFTALTFTFSHDTSFREEFEQLVSAASAVNATLSNLPLNDLSGVSVEAETFALAKTIHEILLGASRKDGRGQDTWNKKVYEFSRWKVAVGPQSKEFLRFLSAVLERPISARRLKTSWDFARKTVGPMHPHFDAIKK